MDAHKNDITVAVYDWHSDAERGVLALQRAGCNMRRISIVGRADETQEHMLGFLGRRDSVRFCGKLGTFWGALADLLLDSAAVFVPAQGYVFVLGSFAAAKLSNSRGGIVLGDASALAGAMSALGIPQNSVRRYETALKAHEFILVAHGDERDAYRVRELLATSGSVSFDHLRVPDEVARAANA